MTAIIFRAFPFRPFPKKKHRERTGILKINSPSIRSFPSYRERTGTDGNGRERTDLQGEQQ